MTIQTLSMNLKGDQGNGIQVISTDLLTNGDTQVIFGEFNPAGAEIAPALRTTVIIPRGNTFSSGSERPADDNPEGIEGDVFLDTDDDKFYSRVSGDWTEQADFTGATGASPVFSPIVNPQQVDAGGLPLASIDNADPLVPILNLSLVTGNTGSTGDRGTSLVTVYASDALGTDKSFTQGVLTFVLFHSYDGTTLPDIATVTGTWVESEGKDGIDGIDSVLAPPTDIGVYNYRVVDDGTGTDTTVGAWGDHVVAPTGIYQEESTLILAVEYPYHLIAPSGATWDTYVGTTTTDGRGLLKTLGSDTVIGDAIRTGGGGTIQNDPAPDGGTIVVSRLDRDGNTIIAVGGEAAFVGADPTFTFVAGGETVSITITSFVANSATNYTDADFASYVLFRATWAVTASTAQSDQDITLTFSDETTENRPVAGVPYSPSTFISYDSGLYFTFLGQTPLGLAGEYPDASADWNRVTLT